MLGRFGEVRKGGVWVCRAPVSLPPSDSTDADASSDGSGDGDTPPPTIGAVSSLQGLISVAFFPSVTA